MTLAGVPWRNALRHPGRGAMTVAAVAAVVIAVVLPPEMVPQFTHSSYLEHFAAFYVVLLAAMAAMPRAQLRRVATGFVIFATLLEATHLPQGATFVESLRNWVADLGGVSAAAAPIVIERFRRRFPKRAV